MFAILIYGKCSMFASLIFAKSSKISNASCLPKRPRQTAQTQIRLLLLFEDRGIQFLPFHLSVCSFICLFVHLLLLFCLFVPRVLKKIV